MKSKRLGRPLFTLGDWMVEEAGVRLGAIIHHIPCPESWLYNVAKEQRRCVTCHTHIPDEVMAVWMLYIYDKYPTIGGGV